MNLLVITQMYSQPDDIGDNKPTKTVNYFVKEWVEMGHNVIVIHCPSKFPLILYLLPSAIKEKFASRISTMVPPIESRKDLYREEAGAKIYRLPMLKMKPGQGFTIRAMNKHVNRIRKILDTSNFRPDVVIGHFANPSLELVAKIAECYDARSSIVFHHDCNEMNIQKYRIDQNISKIGAIGARSIIEANEIQKLLRLNVTPFVCCSGVPNDAILHAASSCSKHSYENGTRYLYVGSLIKRKNVDVLIKAFINKSGEKDTLRIVGGGPEENYLKSIVSESNADNKVTFVGRISRDDVLKEMNTAHVFTLISDYETYGMVYIESMLQGCLTIASKSGGFDGIIKDGVNGFICEPGNQVALENVFERINNLPCDERNKIGNSAINTASHYSEREVAERYLQDVLKCQSL